MEEALKILEGRWKLVILFHLFGGNVLRFSDLERAISEDAHPAASPDGIRWNCPADRPPAGSAQGRVLPNEMGTGIVSSARRLAEMGSIARENV